MSTDPNRWTPDHLRSAANRTIHLEQRRQQLQPILDSIRQLAREVEAELKEDRIEGDLPGQHILRAQRTVRPLFRAANDLQKTLTDLVAFNKRYTTYEELPDRRQAKREQKALAKRQSAQAIGPSASEGKPAGHAKDEYGDVFDGLRKGA